MSDQHVQPFIADKGLTTHCNTGNRARSATDANVLRRKGHLKEQDYLIDFMRGMHATHTCEEVRQAARCAASVSLVCCAVMGGAGPLPPAAQQLLSRGPAELAIQGGR